MILAISTSSPLSSIALVDEEAREVLWASCVQAPGRASETCITLVDRACSETGRLLRDVACFVADVGPGSFTGIRVGVTIAKTFAWNFDKTCAAVTSFDLISPGHAVVVPSRKGEFFLRLPGEEPVRTDSAEGAKGYGAGGGEVFPEAQRVVESIHLLQRVSAYELMPHYLAEPGISTPKRPLSRVTND